jgi:glycosyltransferase involved in cell wall biosynthesis
MHVAIVGPARPSEFMADAPAGLGGSPVNELVRALLAEDVRVTLVTADPALRETWRGSIGGLDIRCVPYRSRARARARDFFRQERKLLAQEISASGADVVHAHWTYEFALAALSVDRSALITAHDAPVTVLRHHRDAYRLVRLLMASRVRWRVQNLGVVSPYLHSRWQREMFWRGGIQLLPNIARPVIPTIVDRFRRDRYLLCVSDSSGLKNVRGLLGAWEGIRKDFPEVSLHLVGPGLVEGFAQGAAQVIALGALGSDEVKVKMEGAVALVHPSFEESFGMVLVEAMAVGTPVIAGSDSGATAWLLKGGSAGLLCDVRSTEALGDACRHVLSAADPLRSEREAALSWISAEFAPKRIAALHLAAYQELLTAAASP